MSDLSTDPRLDEPGTGSPDDLSHYVRGADIMRANINGGLVTAVCGVQFEPVRDPERFPTCPRCEFIVGQLAQQPGAPTPN